MNRQQKEAAVGELVNEFGTAEAVYAVDYRGLSVAQISELRSRLLQNDTKLKVVKNSVTKLAAEQADVTSINDELSGPTALAFVRGDAAASAKILNGFVKESDNILELKGGLLNGKPLSSSDVVAIAKLPTREVLIGQLVGLIASPISGTARTLAALLSAHQSIGVPQPLKMFGNEEQKRTYLPRVAAGEVSSFLLTEPDVGSDPARVACAAEPVSGGYLLNGVKLWATNGTLATLLVVMARVPRSAEHRGGITAFVVEADSPGITVERRNAFMGLRGLENSLTRFHDVFVPEANVIGKEGQGLKIALTTLNTGRLSLPAMCVGACKWCLSVARQWSAERVQWGLPVARHEAVAKKIAFIAATTYGMESMLDLSLLLADDDRNDIRIEAALIKLFASEMAWRVADELVQIRGGRGYETADSLAARGEKPIGAEQILRDLRINRIFEGSTEIMHLFVAREAVDQHLAVAGDIIDPEASLARKVAAGARAGGFYARWLPTLAVGKGQVPNGYAEFGVLAPHLRYVERAARKLSRQTFYAMARWRGKLERKQGFLARLVDIGAELFAMSAACVRARSENDPAGTELADLFCRQARLRAEALFAELWHNTDARDARAARSVVDGRYAGLEAGIMPLPTQGEWVSSAAPPGSTVEDVRRRL